MPRLFLNVGGSVAVVGCSWPRVSGGNGLLPLAVGLDLFSWLVGVSGAISFSSRATSCELTIETVTVCFSPFLSVKLLVMVSRPAQVIVSSWSPGTTLTDCLSGPVTVRVVPFTATSTPGSWMSITIAVLPRQITTTAAITPKTARPKASTLHGIQPPSFRAA